MIDVDLLKTALEIFKAGEIPKKEASGLKRQINLLVEMGWVVETKESYKFALDAEKFAKILSGCVSGASMNIPFRSKIYGKKSFAYIRIPAYITRTFNIGKGDLLIIRFGNVRLSGTISSPKHLFYIHKKYWKDLGLKEGEVKTTEEDYEFVLEGLYRKQGGSS